MDQTNLYRCTPRETYGFINDVLAAGLVPFVHGSPAIGKSALMHKAAKENNLMLIDHRLSTSAPEDLSGLPRFNDKGMAEFAPFADLFPIEGMPLPKDKEGWLLFLDEFNSGSKMTQAAAYKLLLDKMTGQKKLHERVLISAAGNLATDRAFVNALNTALQSRVIHIEMEVNFTEWLYDVALFRKYDPRIIAYLNQYPSKLMDFRPDHQEKTFASPRTWEFMDRLINGKEITDAKTKLYAGTITSGIAVDFVQFTKVYNTIIKFHEIMSDPKNCPLPTSNDARWATISMMMENVDNDNFSDLSQYADRFGSDFRVLFYRSTLVQHPKLRAHPAFAKAMIELAKYLNG